MSKTIGGYIFKNLSLLNIALTHSSFSENNYERLEFLGDSILDFLLADILFQNKQYKEAELTRARANLACEDTLCNVFDKLNLETEVKLGKSCKMLTKAIKGDIIESILATIYLESGIKDCKEFILNNFDLAVGDNKDSKTAFQEYAQKYKYEYEYKLLKTEGPAHNLEFFIELYLNGEKISSAKAKSKIDAEKSCAKQALKKLLK